MRKLTTIILLMFMALQANAEIYVWTDVDGTIHFVDDKSKVSSKYPFETFKFNNDHKWSVDQSDTTASNAFRLEHLHDFNYREPVVVPAPTVVIEQHFNSRIKRHRSDRHDR